MTDFSNGLSSAAVIGAGRRELQFVTFRLGEWEFGADVADVRGIHHGLPMIPTPDAPEAVAGEILISGERIPVLNLSRLINRQQQSRNGNWWIVVLNLLDGPIGILVDKVTEVVRLKTRELSPLEDAQHPVHNYVTAVAHHHDRKISLLDYGLLARELLR